MYRPSIPALHEVPGPKCPQNAHACLLACCTKFKKSKLKPKIKLSHSRSGPSRPPQQTRPSPPPGPGMIPTTAPRPRRLRVRLRMRMRLLLRRRGREAHDPLPLLRQHHLCALLLHLSLPEQDGHPLLGAHLATRLSTRGPLGVGEGKQVVVGEVGRRFRLVRREAGAVGRGGPGGGGGGAVVADLDVVRVVGV